MGPAATPGHGLGTWPLVLRALVVGVAYWAAARVSVAVAIEDEFASIWLPSGLAFVAVLRWGRSMAIAAGLAEFVAAMQGGTATLGVAIGLGVGNAAEALIAVEVARRLGVTATITRSRDVLSLVVAIAAGAAVSATCGVGAYYLAGTFASSELTRQWALFWTSVVLAVVLLAPFLMSLFAARPLRALPLRRAVEAVALFTLVVALSAYVLDGFHPYATVLLYPLLVVSALRFGVLGAAGAPLLATAVAVSYELRDPSVLPELGLDRAESLLAVQALLATAAAGNLVLATLLRERDASRVQLLRSATALEDAQAIASIGSWEWSTIDGRLRTSAELARLFRLEEGTTTFAALLERVHPDDREAVEHAIHTTLSSGGEFRLEHRIHSGTAERIVVHAGRAIGIGRHRRVVATALDVTERTSIDRLRDALIATASHELRTPLTSIVGFADTLVDHWDQFDDQRRLEFLRIIRTQGERLSTVVDDTLMQSRLDAGSLVVLDDPYPVLNAIRDAVQLARVRGVEIVGDTSLIAVGSHEHLTQMVLNFLSNADKYGRPPIRVEVSATDDGEFVEVVVVDHGEGVDPAFRERMFERFTRGPGTDAMPGTGLGMSIVRGLARANGGRVWYQHADGETTFGCSVRRWTRRHAVR